MKTICICGGGHLGHVVGGYIATKKENKVNILTNHPENWSNNLEITLPNNETITGNLNIVTNDASKVIPQADIVFICLPGPYIRKVIEKIKPYLQPSTAVGTVVSNTGFFFQTHDLIPTQPTFGFQRVPFIARTIEYGHKAHLRSFRKELYMVVENANNFAMGGGREQLHRSLESLLDTPITLLDNYLEVSLTNSNGLLHTSRMYSMWKDYHEGVYYPIQPLLYEDWTIEAAQLYIDMDNELQELLKVLGVRKGIVPPVLEYYESNDAESLCHKLQSIPSFKGIKSPMVQTPHGYIPDLASRYFTEDINYSLYYIYASTHRHNIPSLTIDQVYHWGKRLLEE